MRKVLRERGAVPEALTGKKAADAIAAVSAYLSLPDQERQRRRPPLVESIWSSSSLREALERQFLGKCAYCETPVASAKDGGVGHFRPTGSATDFRRPTESPSLEHYCWLAYQWENLLFLCHDCNKAKANQFPVEGPRAAVRGSWKEAESTERALVINPCRVQPRTHIRFNVDGTTRGKTTVGTITVDVLQLNRDGLIEARKAKFDRCRQLLQERQADSASFKELEYELSDSSPYAGGARIFLFGVLSAFARNRRFSAPRYSSLASDAFRLALDMRPDDWPPEPFPEAELESAYMEEMPVDVGDTAQSLPPLFRRPRLDPFWLKHPILRRVEIENFKGISSLELVLPRSDVSEKGAPCAMLLGENSTGKSTVLQAIAIALLLPEVRGRLALDADDYRPRDPRTWELNASAVPRVRLEFDDWNPIEMHIDPLTRKFEGAGAEGLLLFAFGSRRFFGSRSVRRSGTSQYRSLFDPFAKLQSPVHWLETLNSRDFDSVARAMREILALSSDDEIIRDDKRMLRVLAHGRATPLEQLSDGYRSIMAMALEVMRGMMDAWNNLEEARGLVLVDEIETHLHPQWKLRVMNALRRAMPMVQFVATTHDPLCLRGMRSGEVQVLARNDEAQVEALVGLPDVRGLRAEQLLTSEFFGLKSTADPAIESALQDLALSSDETQLTAELSQDAIRPLRWLGDTPVEQIVNEAMRRFVDENRQARLNQEQVREAGVNAVLRRLRAARDGKAQ